MRFLLTLSAPLLVIAGCGEPYGVTEIDGHASPREIWSSAITNGRLSSQSSQYLRQHSLQEAFQKSTRETITCLLAQFGERPSRPAAFALAELCYLEGSRNPSASPEAARHDLTSAIFAYAFLFDSQLPGDCSPFDQRFWMARELHNRAMSKILASRPLLSRDWDDGATLDSLIGPVTVAAYTWKLPFPPASYDRIETAYQFKVKGFDNQSRQDGLGVPLIAVQSQPAPGMQTGVNSFLPNLPGQSFAATFCARFHGSIAAAVRDRSHEISIDVSVLDPLMEASIEIDGRVVPVEANFTTPLASMLEHAPQLSGFKGFMNPPSWGERRGLFMVHPYQKGKIPVVFVNGLMGKPATWVLMLNDLITEESLRSRFQFWYFMYPTGNPVLYSASVLREELQKAKRVFDPDGSDPAFNQMVIVGHSMGGLVTQLQVANSGDEIWNAVSLRPYDSLELPAEVGDLVRSMFFFESLPFVSRVVFMATPHRGSALADKWFAKIFSSEVKLPDQLRLAAENRVLSGAMTSGTDGRPPTAVGSLSAENPVLAALDRLPIAPGVKYHSIIANSRGADQIGGSDSIVPYESSHIDGAVTEKVIHSNHGCTRNPTAIHEVKKILLHHLDEIDAGRNTRANPLSHRWRSTGYSSFGR